MNMKRRWMLLLLAGILLLVGCSQAEMEEPVPAEAVPVVSQDTEGKVIAEAVIEPARWSELRFIVGGTIVEVLVEAGDEVAPGDLLVRLDPTDAELAVREAEAALAWAEAQLALTKAGPRPEEIAVAEAQLEAALAALSRAAAQRDEFAAGVTEAEIAAAQAEIAAAQAELWMAQQRYDQTIQDHEVLQQNDPGYMVRPELDELGMAEKQTISQLHTANEALAAALVQLEALQGGAEARLRDAEAGVWSAATQPDVAQAELDLLRAGSTPEEVVQAEATVQEAEATLAEAKAALERTGLRAPFAGTVTKVTVEVGETAALDEVIVVLATLDRFQARTVDLTELDVARVTEGQAAVVAVDALPDLQLSSRVARIKLQSVDYRGDATYPVIVELDEGAPGLRWGMTAVVEIETD
jgi:multidrug resistance efflux pump